MTNFLESEQSELDTIRGVQIQDWQYVYQKVLLNSLSECASTLYLG